MLTADWDIEGVALSADQRLMAYVVNEAGRSVVRVIERESGRPVDLPALPSGVILDVQFAGRDSRNRLFLQMATYKEAATIYLLDIDHGTLTRITESMLGNIPEEVFVAPELVYIDAFDGLRIPAWLYRPHGIQPGQKVPALLSIHGGPEAQERPGYSTAASTSTCSAGASPCSPPTSGAPPASASTTRSGSTGTGEGPS